MFNRMNKTTTRTKEVRLSSKHSMLNSITSFSPQHLGSLVIISSPGAQLSDCFSSPNLTVFACQLTSTFTGQPIWEVEAWVRCTYCFIGWVCGWMKSEQLRKVRLNLSAIKYKIYVSVGHNWSATISRKKMKTKEKSSLIKQYSGFRASIHALIH